MSSLAPRRVVAGLVLMVAKLTVMWPALNLQSGPQLYLEPSGPPLHPGGDLGRQSPAEMVPAAKSRLFSRNPGGTDHLSSW